MIKNPSIKDSSGFTLVELMVVVAIIGILAAIAIPNYNKFQAKSRQTEAKVALGGIYSIENSFFVEQGTYTTCLGGIGYTPSDQTRYYTTGFQDSIGAAAKRNGVSYPKGGNEPPEKSCPGTNDGYENFAATTMAHKSGSKTTASNLPTTAIDVQTFTAGAAGQINTVTKDSIDQWTINEKKYLQNDKPGI